MSNKKVNCWDTLTGNAEGNQQPIKGSPKAKAMEPGKGSETKRSFSGNGEDDIVQRYQDCCKSSIINEIRQILSSNLSGSAS